MRIIPKLAIASGVKTTIPKIPTAKFPYSLGYFIDAQLSQFIDDQMINDLNGGKNLTFIIGI